MQKALIIGAEGQDGRLLKHLLSSKNYRIWGVGKGKAGNPSGPDKYLRFDLTNDDFQPLIDLILSEKPDEIYYLAAFHHSSQESKDTDYEFIERSIKVNQTGFIRILEICRSHHPGAKIFYTSSSLIFSGTDQTLQNEKTTPEPRCIYSVTKCAAMEAAKHYRGSYNMFVSVGIMYNHESKFRGDRFLSKKIMNETREVVNKKRDKITIGDLSAETDWGYAYDYAGAMWHILQLKQPDTFVISSGKKHKVQDWFEVLFKYLKLDWKKFVTEYPSLVIRKKPVLVGDNTKLLSTGWSPKVSFEEMVIKMYTDVI